VRPQRRDVRRVCAHRHEEELPRSDPPAIIGYWVVRISLANLRAQQKCGSLFTEQLPQNGPPEKVESWASDLNEDAKPQTTKALDNDPGYGIEKQPASRTRRCRSEGRWNYG